MPSTHVATRRPIRVLIPLSAAAAILIVAAVIYLSVIQVPPVYSATGPVEITRTGVSLTILSAPQWADDGGWTGLALVRDQRMVKNLKQGVTEVRFDDVPAVIQPDTVRLRGVDNPDGLAILEQNYQYDLASASAVLKRYVDEQITVVMMDGQKIEGKLLSFDDSNVVIGDGDGPTNRERERAGVLTGGVECPLPDGQPARMGGSLIRDRQLSPRTISRRQVRAINFAKLPEGLLAKPTLVWQIQNKAQRQQQFEVAYMTGGLAWRADYVLKMRVGRRAWGVGRNGEETTVKSVTATATTKNPNTEILDSADLVGYATVTNNSGATYENAQLKLMAGDVNMIRPADIGDNLIMMSVEEGKGGGGFRKGFQEKSFFEYHLYTLERPTTLKNAQTKQIELVSGAGLKMVRTYVYDPGVDPTFADIMNKLHYSSDKVVTIRHSGNPAAAQVVSELTNSKQNGLGVPLPKGVIRLYAPDPEGEDTYVAQTTIDHTPVDEKLRLPWGNAFDIVCANMTTGFKRSDTDFHISGEYSLRNHKDYDVTVTAIVRTPPTTSKFECSRPWHLREVGWIEVQVPVRANTEEKVTFSYDYKTQSGGGLGETTPTDDSSESDDANRANNKTLASELEDDYGVSDIDTPKGIEAALLKLNGFLDDKKTGKDADQTRLQSEETDDGEREAIREELVDTDKEIKHLTRVIRALTERAEMLKQGFKPSNLPPVHIDSELPG